MDIDYASLHTKLDDRVAALKRFAGQLEQVQPYFKQAEEMIHGLEDLYICYKDLDDDAKKALPPNINVVMELNPFLSHLKQFLGDTENNLGFRHLFVNRE